MVKSKAVELDSIFHALSDPTRRSILRGLATREKTVGDIAKPHSMSLAAVSKHLKVLETANLIDRQKQGSFHLVRLKPATLEAADQWLGFYRIFWNQQLDSLKEHIEGEQHE